MLLILRKMKIKFLKIICLLITVITVFGMYSCMKDKGSYSYTELNELISVENLDGTIEATYGRQFTFAPKIVFSQDADFEESKYTYEWVYTGPNGVGGSKLFVLSTTKDLDMVLSSVVAGSYPAYLGIRDKTSGVEYKKSFTLKVVNEFNEGWIMVNEAKGEARVDMLSLNKDGKFDVVIDLLTKVGSELKLEGKPHMAYNYSTGLLIGPDQLSFGLYLGTNKGTTKVEPNTFKWTKTMGLTYEMFGVVPAGFYADVIRMKGGASAYMIGMGDVYYYERTQNIFYSAPLNYVNAEQKSFKVAPFIVSNIFYGVFYDRTNQRFVKHNGTEASCAPIPDPEISQRLFSYKTGKELVYMQGLTYNGGEVFAILKDPISSKKFLARFNPANAAQSYYNEILGEDIVNAEFYAVNPEFGYIFYTVGSKLYEYDMVYKTSKLMADYGSKLISHLSFYEFKNRAKYKGDNQLMVGLYDPSVNTGTEGELAIYSVPGLNANIVLDKHYKGFGRIKGITYRER